MFLHTYKVHYSKKKKISQKKEKGIFLLKIFVIVLFQFMKLVIALSDY